MSVYQDLVERKTKLSLIGLGYVGMPIAVEFAKHIEVVGFDVNEEKIRLYRKGVDPTKEVGDEAISSTGVDFTSNSDRSGQDPRSVAGCWGVDHAWPSP